MKLYDILEPAMYYQQFSVYITNAADQNLLIGRGTRAEMLDEKEHGGCVFSHLLDRVDHWTLNPAGDRVLLFIADENYDREVEELFNGSDTWGEKVNERPWRYSIETEEYTDEFINMVYA